MRWLMAVVVGVALLAATGDAGWAKADSSTLRGQRPWPEGNVGGPCADETIVFHGLVHWVTHTTVDDTGGRHVTGETNFHDVKGVAETSGTRYRLNAVNHFHTNFTNGASTHQESEDNVLIISAGPGDNLNARAFYHLTRNAEDTVTVEFVHAEVACRG
jgi:hypothetical protein